MDPDLARRALSFSAEPLPAGGTDQEEEKEEEEDPELVS